MPENDDSGARGRRLVQSHRELIVYRRARDAAMLLFEISRAFPKEETYSLTSQIRRSSRSVAANIAKAWRKRRYEAAFVSKLSDAESEAAETQVHIEFAVRCGYMARPQGAVLYPRYERLVRMLVGMAQHSGRWCLPLRDNR